MVLNIQRYFTGLFILSVILISYFFSLTQYFLIILMVISTYEIFYNKIFNYKNFYFYFFFFIFNVILYFNENKLLVLIISQAFFLILSLNKNKIPIFFPLALVSFFYSSFYITSINENLIYYIIFLSFINDSSAYIFGNLIKGPLIIPSVSPKKTWSGTIVSALITLITIYLIFNFNILLSLIVSLSFFFGDLHFSYIKRLNKIKDFSNILPGHGGILDRLDSILLGFLFFTTIYFYG